MVRAGFATAYRRYSTDYVDEENEAKAARRGIWAGEFEVRPEGKVVVPGLKVSDPETAA